MSTGCQDTDTPVQFWCLEQRLPAVFSLLSSELSSSCTFLHFCDLTLNLVIICTVHILRPENLYTASFLSQGFILMTQCLLFDTKFIFSTFFLHSYTKWKYSSNFQNIFRHGFCLFAHLCINIWLYYHTFLVSLDTSCKGRMNDSLSNCRVWQTFQ